MTGLWQRCNFNRLTESGVYSVIAPDETGQYHTLLLPQLMLHVSTLWQDDLPRFFAIGQAVQAMLNAE